jgi:hypothetical protein
MPKRARVATFGASPVLIRRPEAVAGPVAPGSPGGVTGDESAFAGWPVEGPK